MLLPLIAPAAARTAIQLDYDELERIRYNLFLALFF